MPDPKEHPAQESTNVPRGQKIWERPACGCRYLTELPPTQCPFCLRPVKN